MLLREGVLSTLESVIELPVLSQSGCEYDGRELELGDRTVSLGSGFPLRCGLVYNDWFLSGNSMKGSAGGPYLAFLRTSHRTPAERQLVQGKGGRHLLFENRQRSQAIEILELIFL